MLLLYISLLSCCFFGSMGGAIEEFQVNFKALVDLASKEIFLPVPARKFQCHHVPCQLKRTVEQLKVHFNNDEMRTQVSRMKRNMARIISALNQGHTKPKTEDSCPMTEVTLQNALKLYQKFFQKLHENC